MWVKDPNTEWIVVTEHNSIGLCRNKWRNTVQHNLSRLLHSLRVFVLYTWSPITWNSFFQICSLDSVTNLVANIHPELSGARPILPVSWPSPLTWETLGRKVISVLVADLDLWGILFLSVATPNRWTLCYRRFYPCESDLGFSRRFHFPHVARYYLLSCNVHQLVPWFPFSCACRMVGDSYPLSIDQGTCLWSQRPEGVVYMVEEEKTSWIQGNSTRRIYVEHVIKMGLHAGHSFGGASRLAVQRLSKWESWWWGVFEEWSMSSDQSLSKNNNYTWAATRCFALRY